MAVGNPFGCIFFNTTKMDLLRQWRMNDKTKHRVTFIRQWRLHRGFSFDKLADRVPMDKGNLSKVARGILPYNQDLLERLADALMTDPASLIMRDPTNADAIWSLWDKASPGERVQIESVANALLNLKKSA